jgi:hypothetical protein
VTGRLLAPVLTALALCTTSIGLLIPMLRDSKLVDPPYGPMVLAACAAHQSGMENELNRLQLEQFPNWRKSSGIAASAQF